MNEEENKINMNKQFTVWSVSRNDLLSIVDKDMFEEEDGDYPEIKTFIENMSDEDMKTFIDKVCKRDYTFYYVYANMDSVIEEMVLKNVKED